MKTVRPSLAMLGVFLFATGALYTLAITGIAGIAFPDLAAGSLVPRSSDPGDAVAARGSFLLGQSFSGRDRFQGRPSAVGFDPATGAASQLGPTSAALARAAAERREALVSVNPGSGEPPAELLLAPGSGLDPHISPAAALYQVPRIAAALRAAALRTAVAVAAGARPRKDIEAELRALVASLTEGRTLGILGEPRVNVLALNLELERLYDTAPPRP